MTALDRAVIRRHSTPIGQTHAPRFIGVLKDKGIVYPGAMMMQRTGEEFAEIVTKVADGVALGWADIPFEIDTSLLAEDGERIIQIKDGIVGPLDNSADADEVTNELRNRVIYLDNDNTAAATSDTAARSCKVKLDRITDEGCYILIGTEAL